MKRWNATNPRTRTRARARLSLIAAPVALALMSLALFSAITDARPDAHTPRIDWNDTEIRRILQHTNLGPPPADSTNAFADHPVAAEFGHRLFFDPRLSNTGEIACATCHDPALGFTDAKSRAVGAAEGIRNSPSLWNVAYQRWYFWDGRADSLWAQALQPIERDIEMAGDRLAVVHLIDSDESLRAAYQSIFGPLPDLSDRTRFPRNAKPGTLVTNNNADDADADADADDPRFHAWLSMATNDQNTVNRVFANVGKAIAAYQRKLISRQSDFDRFAQSLNTNDDHQSDALSESAQRGLRLFVGRGNCRLCHSGPNFSDGEFHNILVPPLAGGLPRDRGRYDAAERLRNDPFSAHGPFSDDPESTRGRLSRLLERKAEQWGQFKTPSLRNVKRTAPYMHEGQYATLRDVFEHYSTLKDAVQFGHHQDQLLVPLILTDEEMGDLEAFLHALTDEDIDEQWRNPPDSP
jgi:cytochrome c peroxidase